MDRDLRNALRLAVTRCRTGLEKDYSQQLEGQFGIYRDGRIAAETSLPQLDEHGLNDRRAMVAAIEHLQANGASPASAVEQFIRESAFSTLNRLAAIKFMEAPERRLVPESIGAGAKSRGFTQFLLLSPEAVRAEPDGGYRLYLELLCEDLSGEIGVLFDLQLPHGILFPDERTLRTLLDEFNAPEIKPVWREDETLGWIYQYFTPKELRDAARKASSAPRNAYELAFRNQFYTPRYVVEFLVDNTLGRTWYEMRQGDTSLVDTCQYLVRRKHPIFLGPDEPEPEWDSRLLNLSEDLGQMWLRPDPLIKDRTDLGRLGQYAVTANGYEYARHALRRECQELATEITERYRVTGQWNGSFEELRCCLFMWHRWDHHASGTDLDDDYFDDLFSLHRAICERWDVETEVIQLRTKRDPRNLRILDPACGSGHFLLYCFDLLETIYLEAWDDPDLGRALQHDYPDLDGFRQAIPELILRHNLHGIDIDLRAVQIAQLTLWLRAQRSWAAQELRIPECPPVRRVNVIAAEPLPGDHAILQDFIRTLDPFVLGDLVEEVWDGMAGVGEIGSLLKADVLLHNAVAETKLAWQDNQVFGQITFFDAPQQTRQERLDLSFVSDEEFWHGAESRVLDALRRYAEAASSPDRYRRRLFADDTARGFALLELFIEPFDVVLMNPPFGAVSSGAKSYIERQYPRTKNDLYAAFVERGLEILRPRGLLGAITSRTGFFLTTFQKWREEILLKEARMTTMADLGHGVLDTAMVETAAYCLEKQEPESATKQHQRERYFERVQ